MSHARHDTDRRPASASGMSLAACNRVPSEGSARCGTAAAWRSLARMDQHKPPQRESLAGLVAALVGTLPVGLYLLLIMALGVSSQADIDNRDVSSGEYVAVFVVPVVGVVLLAAVVIICWRRGWRNIWKVPMIIMIGGLFWPALLLLCSRSVRRGLLPASPSQAADDGTCSACGVPLPADARFTAPANFDYACSGGAYVLTLHNTGAYHVTQPVGVTTDAVKYEVDASVMSGRGTRPRVSRPSALLGIACMPGDDHGYA